MKTKKYFIFAIVSFSIFFVLRPAQQITGETYLSAKNTKSDANLTGREKSVLSKIVVLADEKEVLQGLEHVYVAVSDIEPEIEKHGFIKKDIQTDTELQLRQYGIKVLNKEEWLSTPRIALLGIEVKVLIPEESPAVAAEIRVQLREPVLLLRKPNSICALACTWQRSYVSYVGLLRIRDIREIIKDLVNQFINDYLSANPKEPEKKKSTVEEYDFESLEELLEKLEKAAEGNDKQPKD